MDLQPIYRSAVRQFGSRVRLVRPEQWSSPTPAAEWTVADLVRHVVQSQLDVPRTLSGTVPGSARLGLDAGSGLVEAWDAASTAAIAALAESDAETVVDRAGNELSTSEFGWRTATDLTVHSWDLARAIHAHDELPNDLVGHVLEHAKRDPASWRSDEKYAPAIPVPGCTDDLIELLALTGRNRWWLVGA
jgi:uncharacterized protein (TIGR03086 family)